MMTIIIIGLVGFLLLVLQQIVYRKLWLKNLSVDISFSADHIFEGETGELREIIENRKRLPLAMIKVKFMTDRHLIFANAKGSRTTDNYYRNDVFRIGGGERVIRTLRFQGGRRGYYIIKNLSLVASDLFFMSQMTKELPVRAEIYVYPKPYNSKKMQQALIVLNGDMASRRNLLEDPFEYKGIREYQPYDDMRSINWKATAKTGDFKVNQRNYTAWRSARIFFNIQDDNILRKEEAVELSLRVVTTLCAYFVRQGMQVSCFGNGVDFLSHEPVEIHERAGAQHIDHIYKRLARVDTEQPVVSFVERFRDTVFEETKGTLTCFVAPNRYDDFVELLSEYRDTEAPFVWFYPVEKAQDQPVLPPALARHVCVLGADT